MRAAFPPTWKRENLSGFIKLIFRACSYTTPDEASNKDAAQPQDAYTRDQTSAGVAEGLQQNLELGNSTYCDMSPSSSPADINDSKNKNTAYYLKNY